MTRPITRPFLLDFETGVGVKGVGIDGSSSAFGVSASGGGVVGGGEGGVGVGDEELEGDGEIGRSTPELPVNGGEGVPLPSSSSSLP